MLVGLLTIRFLFVWHRRSNQADWLTFAFMTVFFVSLAFFLGLAKAMTAQGTDTRCVATHRKLEGRFLEDHFPGQDKNSVYRTAIATKGRMLTANIFFS